MLFEKKLNLVLEGETVQENYTALTPLEYTDVIIRVRHGGEGRKKYYEWYKVTNNKQDNLKHIKGELVDKLPDEVITQWKKCKLVYGMDIMHKHGVDKDDGFYHRTLYIVKYPHYWFKDDLLDAYIKEAPFSSDVKHVFGDLFKEL